ncbi:hypothetical protein U1Q18_050837, partial [Sarracenia purpurea var. burkii]
MELKQEHKYDELRSEIENKNEIYSLCQLDNTCTPLTPVDSPRSVAAAADTSATEATSPETYLYENSPQRLIEKLRINPPPSPYNAKLTVSVTKSRYSSVAPATNTQQQRPRQIPATTNTAVVNSKKKQAGSGVVKQPRKVDSKPLRAVLGIEELLLASSSSESSSTSASSPTESLDDYWLMNDDRTKESVSFYGLSSGNENESSPGQIKIEDRANEPAPSSQTNDCVVVKVSDIPKPATVNVFVPFTEEMNKGFLGLDDTGLT